jgi:hypothetical protein
MLKKVSRFLKKLKRKSTPSDTCCECKGNDTNVIECSICLEHIHKNNKSLICGHSFHVICIDNWLNVNFNCPICRRNPNEPVIVSPPKINENRSSILHDAVFLGSLVAGVWLTSWLSKFIYKILF